MRFSESRRSVRWAVGLASVISLAATAGCTATTGPSAIGTGPIAQPPTPGSVTSTVSAPEVGPPVKVGLMDSVELGGIRVSIDSVEPTQVESKLPGEGSGPALVLNLRVKNASGADYRTEQLQANLTDAKGNAATPITDQPASRLPDVLAPDAEGSAKVVFLVTEDVRKPVSLEVTVAAGVQAAIFTGDA